jgi:MFS family permease
MSTASPPDRGTEVPSGAWSPLRVAVFRSLWIAGLVSNVGTYMHTLAAAWAVTDLTTSPTLVSLVQAAWTVPGFLLALLAGALADIVDRRRLIIATQAASVLCATALGVLAVTDALTVSLLLLLTFLLSTAGTIAAPAFMAVTPDLVDRERLPQALGLNSVSNNVAQSVGPAVAGVVIALSGPGAVFFVNAASFVGIMLVVRRWRPALHVPLPPEHVGAAVRTGARYFRNSPRLQLLAARVALSIAVTSSLMALLPVLARDRLDAGAGQFGLLSTAAGVGAIAAVWLLPRANARLAPDAIVWAAAGLWAVGTAAISTTGSLPAALVALACTGAASVTTMNVVFSMYTVLLPSWVRGRASSVAMLTIWLAASAGTVAWGAVASASSVRTALLAAAAAHVVITALATRALPIGRQPEVDISPVAWNMPELQVPPTGDAGPVLVTIDWYIDPLRIDDFASAMVRTTGGSSTISNSRAASWSRSS